MVNYIKGIGDAATRTNEILPSLDARINYFLCGHTSGIIKAEFYEFSASKIDRGVMIKSGMIQAHGYFGCADTDTQINFIMPATTSYVHIFAEIDLSIVPNRFEIKATAISNSAAVSFRQDNLRSTTNGKFQLHLWQVTLTATTITLTDKRAYIDKPLNAVNAETSTTQEQSDNSNRVATTSYVRRAISDAFNITEADVRTSAGKVVGKVRRQGNFVICSGGAYGDGGGVTAIIPEGYRPKTEQILGVSGSFLAMSQYPNNPIGGGTSGQVFPDGTLKTQVQGAMGNYLVVNYFAATFYGGWEITD